MKSIFKLLGSLLLGACIGLVFIIPVLALINGEPITDVIRTIFNNDIPKFLGETLLLLAFVAVAFILQIIIHEGGHLVAGLLTGYRFVSFRFMNYTLIRRDGRLQWRNFELSGTGGQCLMSPPDKPLEQIDTRWYNAGGVLANIITALIALLLIWAFDLPSWLNQFLAMMAIIGFAFALLNGIPMKVGGVANDGCNLFQLEKDLTTKKCFCDILEVNARVQEGELYNDMPERLFALPQPFDWDNSMHVGAVFVAATRMMSQYKWEDAYQLLAEAINNKDKMMKYYQLELECMMTLACIATKRDEEARQHYSDEIANHVTRHASTQSDKQLVSMATALALDGDRARAGQILRQLEADRDKYIHQGDVATSLDVMRWLLEQRQ